MRSLRLRVIRFQAVSFGFRPCHSDLGRVIQIQALSFGLEGVSANDRMTWFPR